MGTALAKATALHEADESWAARCGFWLNSQSEIKRRGAPVRRNQAPLILTGHGMSLRINHGALVVRNGFTHYPQTVDEHRFFPGGRNLPSRIVALDGSGTLSFDVISWLSAQEIPLVQIDWQGRVVAVIGASYANDPERVARQLEALKNGHAVKIATSLVRSKIVNSITTLRSTIPPSAARELALKKLRNDIEEIRCRPPKSINKLLGIEGRVAYAYFRAWQSLPLRWQGIGRCPIPDDWHHVGPRQSAIGSRIGSRNRRASHPVNAILNFAYAILESQVRIQVVSEGYDPAIGYLHAYGLDRDALVFDLMEPLRPMVDRKVLEFVKAQTFHPADFTIRSDGVCRLNPEMAKHAAKLFTELDSAGRTKALCKSY